MTSLNEALDAEHKALHNYLLQKLFRDGNIVDPWHEQNFKDAEIWSKLIEAHDKVCIELEKLDGQ